MTLGIQPKEFSICFICPENFVSQGLRALQVPLENFSQAVTLQGLIREVLQAFWKKNTHKRTACSVALQRATLELCQSGHWVLGYLPDLSCLSSSRKSWWFQTSPIYKWWEPLCSECTQKLCTWSFIVIVAFWVFSPKLTFCKNKTISKKNTLNRLRKPLPMLIGFVVVSLKNDHYTVVSSTANMKALWVACLSNTGTKVRKCVFELAKRHSVKVDLGKSKYSFT